MIRRAAVLLLVAVAAASPGAAGGPRDVSALLRPIREKHDVPGLVALTVGPAGIDAQGADGVRRRGGKEPITVDDPMHLGSCTKAMTATLCAILVHEGKLRWDSSPADVLHGHKRTIDPGWKEATLEMLLRNRGGAPADLDADGLWKKLVEHQGTPLEQRRTLSHGVLRRPPVHPPGTKYLYSNAGFALAGQMAEETVRRRWEYQMQERLFRPLEMRSAGFGTEGFLEARGHRADGTPVEPGPGADNPAAIGPAGSVHASLPDWAQFVSLHLRRGKDAPEALAKIDFERLHTPPEGADYAMGWNAAFRPWAAAGRGAAASGKPNVLTHAGSNSLWYCTAWLAPERGFAVLAACNQGGDAGAKACDDAAAALIRERAAVR